MVRKATSRKSLLSMVDKFVGLHESSLAKIYRSIDPKPPSKANYPDCRDKLRKIVLSSYIDFIRYADDDEFLQILFSRGLPRAAKNDDNKKQAQSRIYQAELAKLRAAIQKHEIILYAKASRALVFDDYGNIREDNRRSVFEDFLDSHKIAQGGDLKVRDLLFGYFKRGLIRFEKNSLYMSAPPLREADRSGIGFEIWTSQALKRYGWSVVLTAYSGDQGVDLVAQKDGIRVAVQCKRYTGSVGNKAVQEVYAGMKHLQLDYAVVISTGKFTKSATTLAASTGVFLQSERDIPYLFELITHGSCRQS